MTETKVHNMFHVLAVTGAFLAAGAGAAGAATISEIESAIISREYEVAQALSREIIASRPAGDRLQKAYYYLGLSQLRTGQLDEARKTFNLLIAAQPADALRDKAYLGIIDAYSIEGDYATVLRLSEGLLTLSPKSESLSLIYLKMGRAHLKLTHWDDARQYLQKIVDDFPRSLESRLAKQMLDEKKYFAVQVGSFLDRERAEALSKDLKDRGEYSYIVETVDTEGRQFYRVRVGRFSGLQDAQAFERKMAGLGYPTYIYP